MKPAILGKKIGMTRLCDQNGLVTPVTVIQAGPCTVIQVRTTDRDGYDAVQLGFEDVKPHRSTKPLIGHAAMGGTGPKRLHREVRLEAPSPLKVGEVVTVSLFEDGAVKYVDVTGVCKGRGFAGVMRRHNFGGMGASHGTERKHRCSGGIGGQAPRGHGRAIKKGKRMPGHMGNVRVTTRNQQVMAVDKENHLLVVKGSIPGPIGSFVYVRQAATKS